MNDKKKGRYEHWLFRTAGGSFPKAVLCLSTDIQWSKSAGDARAETASLLSWSADYLSGKGGMYDPPATRAGPDAESFWTMIREYLRQGRSLFILSDRTREALSALGVWHGIETAEIEPAGNDANGGDIRGSSVSSVSRAGDNEALGRVEQVGADSVSDVPGSVGEPRRPGRARRKASAKKRSPLLILNDPPIVLQLQLRGCKGKITWVDVANYGVSAPASACGSAVTARWLSEWLTSATSALQLLGVHGWRTTAGSQAMHAFRSEYLETPILSHTHRRATALETSGIYGGRNECFQLGNIPGPVYVYDFRSLYPYICTRLWLPVRLVAVELAPSIQSLCPQEQSTYVIADVDIETDEPYYPRRDGNETRFPIGRFRTTLGGEELALAVRSGDVLRVRCAAYYEAEPVLSRICKAMFGVRAQALRVGNMGVARWIKRLLVSLPGKFAQQDRHWTTRRGADPICEWGEWYSPLPDMGIHRWRSIGGIVQVETVGEYVSGAVPAITAAVNSAGRSRLLQAIRACGWENVYYCDTDSIVTNETGRENLTQHDWIRDDELGYLRLEVTAPDALIYGLKHYQIGSKRRWAGRPGGGEQYYSEGGPESVIPWIGWTMRHQQRPADWRRQTTYTRGPGRYDSVRPTGGRLPTLEINEVGET